MGYSSYQIDLPEPPEAVAFINGFLARNLSGLLWMWKNVFWITNATAEAEGWVQVKTGICSPNEVVMVSLTLMSARCSTFQPAVEHWPLDSNP